MSIEDDIAFFERVPTLGPLGRAALRILAIGAENRYLQTGEVLFNAGDRADAGYVVQEGSFSLAPPLSGRAKVITVGPGALLGELAILTDTTRPATATALESSTVLRIPRSLFLKMLEGCPDAAVRLRDVWASRTDQSSRDMQNVRVVLDVHERK
jgi:CRP-like cAMP-binding protein